MNSDVCAQTHTCERHGVHFGSICPLCIQRPDATSLRINALSMTIGEALRHTENLARRCARLEEHLRDAFDKQRELQIESRKDYLELSGAMRELEAENASLRRRVAALEHRCTSNQEAHNKLADQVEEIADVVLGLEERTRPCAAP